MEVLKITQDQTGFPRQQTIAPPILSGKGEHSTPRVLNCRWQGQCPIRGHIFYLQRLVLPKQEPDLFPLFLCSSRRGGIKHLKVIRPGHLENGVWKFSTELWKSVISRKLSHPKLVKFYGVCSERYPICIVTEYITNGCLLNYLKSHGKGLEPSQLLEMCYDVCEGMAFLERHQFIHRDLVSKASGSSQKGKKGMHSSCLPW